MIKLIVAFDEARGIGFRGRLPWRLPEDLRHFREATLGHAVVMGRRTFESIGRPLPGRRNIVLSRGPPSLPGVEAAASLEESFLLAGGDCWVIGGASVYERALPCSALVLASVVRGVHEADAFFPELGEAEWSCREVRAYDAFAVRLYERRAGDGGRGREGGVPPAGAVGEVG
jgi:dihydrofolate reductase